MRSIIYLIVILNLNYSFAYPNADPKSVRYQPDFESINSSGNPMNDKERVHKLNIGAKFHKVNNEDEKSENSLIRSKRAVWFGRVRVPSINLFNSNRLINNNGYYFGFSTNRLSNTRTTTRTTTRTITRTITGNQGGNYVNANNQPVNNNYESNNRISSSSPSTYYVPSASRPSTFVEATNYVTPPNRSSALIVSSTSAPVEHSNDDWTSAPDE